MSTVAELESKIENELRKPPTERNEDLLTFWKSHLPAPQSNQLVSSITNFDALVEKLAEVHDKINFTILKELHDIRNKVSLISDPSTCCKSTKEAASKLTTLNEALRMDIADNFSDCIENLSTEEAQKLLENTPPVSLVSGIAAPAFTYKWKKDAGELQEEEVSYLETESYLSFQDYLNSIGETSSIVGNGESVTKGLLFNVAICSKRKNIEIRNAELRKTSEEPKHVFNLSGRCDLITLFPGKTNINRMNIRYAIEVKVKGFNLKEALRETYLQLVGLSVANRNTSPPVMLTDLSESHYVLFLELLDRVTLKFKLRIQSFPSLVMCIQRCRALASRPCITENFGSSPSPTSSTYEESDVDCNSIESALGNCSLKSAEDD